MVEWFSPIVLEASLKLVVLLVLYVLLHYSHFKTFFKIVVHACCLSLCSLQMGCPKEQSQSWWKFDVLAHGSGSLPDGMPPRIRMLCNRLE